MQRYFIYLAYDGTNYHGWQIQPNGITVQECVEKAISTLLQKPITVVGAGRTDTGVHARLLVAHFDVEAPMDTESFTERMNRILPKDIAVHKTVPVKSDAHSRFDALSRTYKYYLSSNKNPFGTLYSTRNYYGKMDFEAMNRAAQILFEYEDFTSFSKLHTEAKTNNCTIMYAKWTHEGEFDVFTIRANRFLRNMVRAIVGTMFEVGRGKLTVEGFRNVIEQKNRSKAGTSAHAEGLFLEEIAYPNSVFE